MEMNFFEGVDLENFWSDCEYAKEEYVSEPASPELISGIEEELGYKLPASYIELMKTQNGGIPENTCFPGDEIPGWGDFVQITGIMGIGKEKRYSLCGEFGTRFWIENWEYPDIGIVICDTQTGGHDLIMLDYRECGKEGEPQVVHVDQESDYEITFLAENFETFIKELVNEEEYDTSEEDKEFDLQKVKTSAFSPLLKEISSGFTEISGIEEIIRKICTQIVEDKGFFALHADELSLLMYDIQFLLYTHTYPQTTRENYKEKYEKIIALDGAFSTGGYAPGFITEWLDNRIEKGNIQEENNIISFSPEYRKELINKIKNRRIDIKTGI